MGIPRFYRYVSERYPLINQPISDVSLLPEFDCFYLDMNGIIHNCTHTDAADSELSTLGLPAQLHNIFTYMDRLITHIIKPKKIVYIAIDGVAPRAKLNQQRSRRFRAGLEREEALEKERHRQITLEDEKNGNRGATTAQAQARFDSNCITPGTQFLHELSQHLVWFVRYKMKTDPIWARLDVYYSGSEVPGEGEHKIVDFIRHRKMAPGYEPNVRHCMYGSDADLMLLGLMTHEPHFTLVREVVVWGSHKSSKVVAKKIAEEQWQLVHLSLFREYLMMEMRVVAPLDGERMLDDFILLTYLLGNDFIPHSPTLEISEDAIPLLMRVYREHLEKHAGQYLTGNGELINIPMLQDLFITIGAMEEEILINRAVEEAKRSHKGKRGGEKVRSAQVDVVERDVSNALSLLNDDEDDEDNDGPPPLVDDDDEDDDIGIDEALDGEEEAKRALALEKEALEIFAPLSGSESFQDTKWTYYERKFGMKRGNGNANNAELEKVKKSYMEALVWCLHYYFQGPPSWSWYYPYHYAPMISDLTDIADVVKSVKFGDDPEFDGPLRPFEQLMANLPASSAHLVPEPYRFLMMSPLSPIKHFYPVTFEIDMEGKRNPWEGVNILPFIDVALLKSAIAQYCPDSRLSKAERQRNTLQMLPLKISPDPQAFETVPSTMPGVPGFPDILACSTRVTPYALPKITGYDGRFQSKLMDGVTLPMAGFPSLYTIPLEAVRIENIRVNCFGMGSRKATLILQLPPTLPFEQAVNPNELLGKTALVNWPNLHEAKVIGISTLSGEYRLDSSSGAIKFSQHEADKKTQWAQYAQSECYQLLCGRGTPGSGGLDFGKMGISVVLHVLPLQGMVSNPITGAVEKKFGQSEAVVPLQLAVVNRKLFDERFEESGPVALPERFPKDSVALITRGKWLGCTANVQEAISATNKVRVHVNTIDKEPPFGYVIAQQITDKYLPGYMVAQKLGISTTTLGLLTGSVFIKPGDYEIGLNLRFRKDLLLPGFCRLVTKANSGGNADSENVWTKGDIVKIVGSDVNLSGERENARRSNEKGGAGGTSWEYTDRTVAVLAAYKAEFPDVIQRLDKLPFGSSFNGKDIFGTSDRKLIEQKAEAVIAWIDSQRLGKKDHSKHIPISSEYMSLNAMRAVEAAGMLRAKEREKHAAQEQANPVVAEIHAGDLFRPNPLVNQDLTGSVVAETASKNPGPPRLGDRVINISARGVPFGHRGTIVATHVSSKCVEVLFDEGFTGGEPLYGSTTLDRGKIVPWNQIMCVSAPVGQSNPREREREPHATQESKAPSSRQVQEKLNKQSKEGLAVSSNNRKARKPAPGSAAPTRILTPAMVQAATQAQAPAPAPAVPAPPPPDPSKIKSLMKKWNHQGSIEETTTEVVETTVVVEQKTAVTSSSTDGMSPSVAALFNSAAAAESEEMTVIVEQKTGLTSSSTDGMSPSVAALFNSAAAAESEEVAPAVAALFSAAAAAAPPPPPPQQPPSNALDGLFPLANGAPAMPAPPLPAYAPPMLGQHPMHPPHIGLPMGFQPGFINPYAMPPPPPQHYPHSAPPPPQQQQPRRENRRGSRSGPTPAPVASLTDFPPLGAEPVKPEPKTKPTPPLTVDASAEAATGEGAKKPKQKWTPKADKAEKPTAAAKPTSLLRPSQVMRQQPKPAAPASN